MKLLIKKYILETKPINNNYNYDNYFSLNPTLNYNSIRLIKNEYSYQINNKNENIYNNKISELKKRIKYKNGSL